MTNSAFLGEIVNLTQSAHLTIRTKAALLIGQLFHNSGVFDVLQAAGALDRLHHVNQSSHLNTNVSEDTERKLLSYNLSSKMAHFNRLDETDRIDHTTYYDCGANPFDTLEVLNEQPVMTTKTTSPIWLVKMVSDLEINNNDADTVITVTQSQEDTTKAQRAKKKTKRRIRNGLQKLKRRI